MVASPVKMPMLPVPASVRPVLIKPALPPGVPHPPARDCYGCVDWFLFDDRTPELPQSTARPPKNSGR